MTITEIINKINTSNIGHRLFKGAVWSLLGAIGGRGIVLLSFIFVARIIGQYTYGQLGLIRSTINMFTVFAGLGMGITASKYIAQYRNTEASKAGEIYTLSTYLSLFLGGLCAILLIIFSKFIAIKSLNDENLATEVQIGALVLFFTTINASQNGALAGFEDFKSIAINTFIANLCQGILLVFCSYIWGITGSVAALGIGCLFLVYLNRRSITKKMKVYNIKHNHISKKTFNVIWNFSLPSMISSLAVVPVLWWSKIYLVNHTNYSVMASYDVADQWSVMALFIPATITQIILPMLSNILVEGSRAQYLKLIKVNLFINISASLSISVFIIILAPWILKLYGKEFNDTMPLIILMFASVFMSACNVVGQVIASKGKMWTGFFFNFLWALAIILFTFLFVGKGYGASGLAAAILCSYLLHFMLQSIYMVKFALK